jgi:hypothetical protein
MSPDWRSDLDGLAVVPDDAEAATRPAISIDQPRFGRAGFCCEATT